MARYIEPGSVLSQEDYDYLKARVRVDEAVNVWGCTIGDDVDTGEPRTAPALVGDLAEMQTQKSTPAPEPGTLQSVHPDQVVYIEGSELAQDDEEGDDLPYDEWSVADLEEEVDRRNAERDEDDQIVPEGSGKNGNILKGDLVAALEADDQSE